MQNTLSGLTPNGLSPAAQKAVTRIRVLRVLAIRTGLQTKEEQIKILLALPDADCLAASAVLYQDYRKGAANGNDPR
jgi:hypothetical protein